MSDLSTLVNLAEFEPAAEAKLPRMVFDYYAGGAGDEVTLRGAREAWDAIEVRYRVLRAVGGRTSATTILGTQHPFPALVAPMAFQRMAHPDGELATARAASAAGIGVTLSTLASTSMEDVRAEMQTPLWFQLYIAKDRGLSKALVERAEAAGCGALVLTVDAPLLGRRERDFRNKFRLDPDLPVPNLTGSSRDALSGAPFNASALNAFVSEFWDESIAWPDIDWLRSITKLPVLVKGVVRGDDARTALDHGAAGVIVSNHGGRQLDGSRATARALPEVAEAVRGEGALLVDGGIRRGTDILKALALGANAVLIGRPVLWGLAVGGQAGVARVLQMLKDEFDLAMALAGVRSPAEITRDLVT